MPKFKFYAALASDGAIAPTIHAQKEQFYPDAVSGVFGLDLDPSDPELEVTGPFALALAGVELVEVTVTTSGEVLAVWNPATDTIPA